MDESHEVHYGMKGRNGCLISIVLSVTHCILSNQKLNTKRSTKLELFGASNYGPYSIWYVMFMHHQGYLKNPKSFSRTKSAMSMEVKWRNSYIVN